MHGEIEIWDNHTDSLLDILEKHQTEVKCVSWSPDDMKLVSLDDQGMVKIWIRTYTRAARVT